MNLVDGDVLGDNALSTVRTREVRCAAEGRVPLGGLTLLTGEPGRAKSLVLAHYTARWSQGQMAGALLGIPAAVVLASTEDDPETVLKPRPFAAGVDCNRIALVRTDLGPSETRGIYLPHDTAPLGARMREVGARALLLDPLLSFVDAGVNVWKEPSVRQALLPIVAMAARLDAAVLGVMHANERETDEIWHRIAHSLAFGAVARSMLVVMPDPETDHPAARVLVHAKYDHGPRAIALRFRIEGATVTDGEETAQTAALVWGGEAPEVTAESFTAKRGPAPGEAAGRGGLPPACARGRSATRGGRGHPGPQGGHRVADALPGQRVPTDSTRGGA